LSQALPVLPQLPVFDGRKPDLLQRPTDAGDRAGQRQTFDKLLERFTRRDAAEDTGKEPAREPAADAKDETAAETEGHPDTVEGAPAGAAESKPAQAMPEPAAPGVIAPAAVAVTAAPSALPVAATAPQAAAPVVQAGEPQIIATAAPAIVTAVPMAVPQQPVSNGDTPTANLAASPVAVVAADGAAPVPMPEVAPTGTGGMAAPATPPDAAGIAVTDAAAKPAATGAAPPAAAAAVVLPPRLPAAKTAAAPAPAETIDPGPQARLDGKPQAGPSIGPADPLAAAARDEGPANAKTPEQPFGALLTLDTPRSAAAHYHKVAETIRTAAAETPAPADQVSIRLLHAVAEGKRTIQMHLHPAELGSIDVRMQWQGDRLTAQFQVDRPETLQLLQRDIPALERTLNQAGVNVDSGSLSFSLRQQTGNGQSNGGQPFDPGAASAVFGNATDLPLDDEPLGQVIRDGLLSIRV
jgi:flagellar hook-length control protein FliK